MASAYGTSYALQTIYYLGGNLNEFDGVDFLLSVQNESDGFFIEPSMQNWNPPSGALHSREHLKLHTTCAVLPLLADFGIHPYHPLRFADSFRGSSLFSWLKERDLHNPWLEGNNLLFAGQILLQLMTWGDNSESIKDDFENLMNWLDERIDPQTGLWGTDLGANIASGIYGGYHQLLLYYFTDREIQHPKKIIDCCLKLQHLDGGYSPAGDAGACEDVDTVDILVNLYKRYNYRRPEIRWSLRRCAKHIINLQNNDGGFPYCQTKPFTHNGLKGTEVAPGESTVFATWFRVHTLALIGELLPEVAALFPNGRNFNRSCSMGWHDKRCQAPAPLGNEIIDCQKLLFYQRMRKVKQRLLALRRLLR